MSPPRHLLASTATAAMLALLAAAPAGAAGNGATATLSKSMRVGALPFAVPADPSRFSVTASDFIIDVTGVDSFATIGNASNVQWVFQVAPSTRVDSIAWDLSLMASTPSWLSEATISLRNSNGVGVALNPGFGSNSAGTADFLGSRSLSSLGLAFNTGSDGLLLLEFSERLDDLIGAADARWLRGTITLGNLAAPVPEPRSYGLMALGLIGVALVVRRRRRQD